jgi:hypothetical protein
VQPRTGVPIQNGLQARDRNDPNESQKFVGARSRWWWFSAVSTPLIATKGALSLRRYGNLKKTLSKTFKQRNDERLEFLPTLAEQN